jgi:hypothetical protein
MDYTCGLCGRPFASSKAQRCHQTKAKSCAWWKSGKLRDVIAVAESEGESEIENEDEDVDSVMDQWDHEHPAEYNDLFHFVQHEEEEELVEIGEAGPGPSTQNHRSANRHRVLDDDDDTRVIDEHPTAGRSIRMGSTVYEQWHTHFDGKDSDGDYDMEGTSNVDNSYLPFASELDCKIAMWAVKENIGHNAMGRLLAIPGVRLFLFHQRRRNAHIMKVVERLSLSYDSVRSMHKAVDSIPERAGAWITEKIWFKTDDDHKHTVRRRNPLDAIRTLLGDPSLSGDITYAPTKIFADSNRQKRIYNEMWTGKWWHAVQVCLQLTLQNISS